MPIESLTDRRSYFHDDGDIAVFARTVTNVVDPDGDFELLLERKVTGLFDRAYYEQYDSSGYTPVFAVVDEDVLHVEQEQRLMLLGHVYEIKELQPDGEGFTQLQLYHLGRYTVSQAWGYGSPYGALRYGERRGSFDLANPPLDYPYTVSGVYDIVSGIASLT